MTPVQLDELIVETRAICMAIPGMDIAHMGRGRVKVTTPHTLIVLNLDLDHDPKYWAKLIAAQLHTYYVMAAA